MGRAKVWFDEQYLRHLLNLHPEVEIAAVRAATDPISFEVILAGDRFPQRVMGEEAPIVRLRMCQRAEAANV